MTSYRLDFPADVTPEAIADVLRVAATEPRGSLSATPVPIVFETILQPRSISWWLTLPPRRIKSVRAAAQRALPGLVWTKAERPSFEATRAIELRLRSGDRLLATDLAEQTVARLLTLSGELRKGEALLIQWAGGVVAAASANTTSLGSPARTIWNLPDWGLPERNTEEIDAARKKGAEHIFAAVGRVAVGGASGGRAKQLLASAGGAYQLLRAPGVGLSRRPMPSAWVRRPLERPTPVQDQSTSSGYSDGAGWADRLARRQPGSSRSSLRTGSPAPARPTHGYRAGAR